MTANPMPIPMTNLCCVCAWAMACCLLRLVYFSSKLLLRRRAGMRNDAGDEAAIFVWLPLGGEVVVLKTEKEGMVVWL